MLLQLLLLAAAAAAATPASTAAAPAATSILGVNVHSYTPDLDLIEAAGLRWLRMDIAWEVRAAATAAVLRLCCAVAYHICHVSIMFAAAYHICRMQYHACRRC